jgi:hypothetical protein
VSGIHGENDDIIIDSLVVRDKTGPGRGRSGFGQRSVYSDAEVKQRRVNKSRYD